MSQSIKLSATAFSLLARIFFILFVILLLFFAPVVISQVRVDSSQIVQEIRTFELGKPIERELKGGEVHAYQITLASNQYLHMVVDQRGVDVVTLFGPDSKQLVERFQVSIAINRHENGVLNLESLY